MNFLPGDQNLVTYFEGVKAEIQQRIADGEGAVRDERYRLFFDGMMNWNKVGWLADKFAAVNACVVAGRPAQRVDHADRALSRLRPGRPTGGRGPGPPHDPAGRGGVRRPEHPCPPGSAAWICRPSGCPV